MAGNDSRVQAYKRLLRETAKQLGEKTTSEIVKHVTGLKMCRENLMVQMLQGQRVDPADWTKLDAALRSYLPAGAPLSVTLNIVDAEPWQSPPDPEPTPPPAPPPTDTKPSSPSEPSNVIPLKRIAEQERADMERACAPPIKRANEPWRSHVGPVGDPGFCNPFSTFSEPSPYRRGG
jgi:hypothetical protein